MATQREKNRATELVVMFCVGAPMFIHFILYHTIGEVAAIWFGLMAVSLCSGVMVYTLDKHKKGEMWD